MAKFPPPSGAAGPIKSTYTHVDRSQMLTNLKETKLNRDNVLDKEGEKSQVNVHFYISLLGYTIKHLLLCINASEKVLQIIQKLVKLPKYH